jgi:hypothetical protein
MIDANEWVLRLTAFDLAKADLLDLAEKAHEISERLTTNWQELHPPAGLKRITHPAARLLAWTNGQAVSSLTRPWATAIKRISRLRKAFSN